jgi:hypothetical protein
MNLGVRIVGSEKFKRFKIIRNHNGVEEFWTGNGWAREGGLLYHSERDLAPDYERLEEERTAGLPERVFVATVAIRVRSDQPFSLQALKEYLYSAARLHLDMDERGKGPVDGSTTFVEVVWNDTREVTPQDQGAPQT